MLEIITLSTCLILLITSKISIAYWDLKQTVVKKAIKWMKEKGY